ncbi:DMT family transporter [Devosia sp. BK]|uniref:DMT family transporter n=1 Tax=Devosia sp. BK TaxID=2871706 RepID=UPI00293AF93D|nr:DMT family transporter [Devosia sp. BK]MDV3249731.1 DMT family transporter [Devosia sp. BK]
MTTSDSRDEGQRNLAAGIFSLLTTLIFVLVFTSGRLVSEPVSPIQVMFLRFAGGFITITFIAIARGESWRSLQSRHRPKQVFRVLAGGFGGAALIFGNMHMPIVDANAIGLLNVVFAVSFGALFLGDRLSYRQIAGGAICLLGASAVMASRGAFSGFNTDYLFPASVVVVGAVLMGVESIFIKVLTSTDRPMVTLAHANTLGMLLLAIPALMTWQSWGFVNLTLLLLGPMAILGQYLNIRAYSLATVSVLAPLSYASLLFAAVIGWAFFNEIPTCGVVLGAALIALGGAVIILSRR